MLTMIKTAVSVCVLIFLCSACASNAGTDQKNRANDDHDLAKPKDEAIATPTKPGFQCYESHNVAGSTTVQLAIHGNQVDGTMTWVSAKTGAGGHGTLKGTKTRNLIDAFWTYQLSGVNGKKQVLFKMLDPKSLVEHGGELVESLDEPGTLIIKNPKVWVGTKFYTAIDCQTIK